MVYKETYQNLYHGTDAETARKIEKTGFEIRGCVGSWCGKGVYFYDVKRKAWWAAARKCREIKNKTNRKIKPDILLADIVDLEDDKIFDMRIHTDICDFEEKTKFLFEDGSKIKIEGIEDENERIIILRSIMISYYAHETGKKLVIGQFEQRPQEDYNHIKEFSSNLNIVFGIETIYCVKDKSIIKNVRRRCNNEK